MDGERVPPAQDERQLKGALVDVYRATAHQQWWKTKGDGCHMGIRSIAVLQPPSAERSVVSPTKKQPLAIPSLNSSAGRVCRVSIRRLNMSAVQIIELFTPGICVSTSPANSRRSTQYARIRTAEG